MAGSPEMTAHLRIQKLEKDKELLARAVVTLWWQSYIENLDEIEDILSDMGLDLTEESFRGVLEEEEEETSDGKIYEKASEEEEPHFSLALVQRLLAEDREEPEEVQEKGKE